MEENGFDLGCGMAKSALEGIIAPRHLVSGKRGADFHIGRTGNAERNEALEFFDTVTSRCAGDEFPQIEECGLSHARRYIGPSLGVVRVAGDSAASG